MEGDITDSKNPILIIDSSGRFEAETKNIFLMLGLSVHRVPNCKTAIRKYKECPLGLAVVIIREGHHEECYSLFRKLRSSLSCALLVGILGSEHFIHNVHTDLITNGADVVVGNPSNTELGYQALAIMKMLCKQRHGGYWTSNDSIVTPDIEIIIPQRKIFVKGCEVSLPPKEFGILVFLARNPCKVMTYAEIYTNVWHEPFEFVSREVVWSHVYRLRFTLKASGNTSDYIKNSKGYGYSFEPKPYENEKKI